MHCGTDDVYLMYSDNEEKQT